MVTKLCILYMMRRALFWYRVIEIPPKLDISNWFLKGQYIYMLIRGTDDISNCLRNIIMVFSRAFMHCSICIPFMPSRFTMFLRLLPLNPPGQSESLTSILQPFAIRAFLISSLISPIKPSFALAVLPPTQMKSSSHP